MNRFIAHLQSKTDCDWIFIVCVVVVGAIVLGIVSTL